MGIEIENIHKRFDDAEVLKGIDFGFETGKVNMIIGASGSGKSVLLKCMVGLMIPEEGAVRYDGRNLMQMEEAELRKLRRRVGMLFQSSALFDSMTVGENISFPLRMFTNMSGREQRNRVNELLERVNMPGTAKRYPSEISGGMRKRVGIARAIALQPDYLFCDEPNSGLDPQTAELIDDLLRQLTDDLQITSVIVSHDMKSVLTIGDKIMFIYKGFKEWEGNRSDVAQAENRYLKQFIATSGVALDTESNGSSHLAAEQRQ